LYDVNELFRINEGSELNYKIMFNHIYLFVLCVSICCAGCKKEDVPPATPTTPASTVSIGDTLQGGIVFYVNGSNGLIAAPSNIDSVLYWGCYGTEIADAFGSAIGTGNANTMAIAAGCSDLNIAAKACADLVLSGYDDWYLPSIDELELMNDNLYKAGLGGFDLNLGAQYWSSTQYNSNSAYNYDFSIDFVSGAGSKNWTFQVRPIRSF
jgi:hypothetical protein